MNPSVAERFFALTPERILDAVETIGRRSTGYALALNSLENRVYEVEMEDGERLVAKFYRPGRWSRAAILAEHAFLAELQQAELPVVPPVALDERGRTLGELTAFEGAIPFCLFPKVRGRPPEDLTNDQLEWLGRLVARLHSVGAARGASERGVLDAESYGANSVRVLREGDWIPESLSARYLSLADRLVEACARQLLPFQDSPRIRLHGDCHLGNLLWGAKGPFFLDFDDFLVGLPVQDIWLIAPGHDAEALAQRERVVLGYLTMRDFDRSSLRLVEALRALRILRYAAWIAQRWGDPSFARAFPGFTEAAFWQREIAALDEQLARIVKSGD